MLKSKESKEAEIYECLSRDDSYIINDMENLGPWHKYGGSIHQELQKDSSKSNQEESYPKISLKKTQYPLDEKFTKQLRSSHSKDDSIFTNKEDQNQTVNTKQEKINFGFFVQCYPNRNKFDRQKQINFQTSKEYFEKIAMKMMYGFKVDQNTETNKTINSNQYFIKQSEQQDCILNSQEAPKTVSRNYFYKKELKFNNINPSHFNRNKSINNSTNFLLNQPQNIIQSRIPFHKIINKKTVICFASQNQLLEKQYQEQYQLYHNKIKRMVRS